MNDSPEVTPGRPGSARVEYFACRKEVETILAKGYSIRLVYESMKDRGRVTCYYSAFCDYVRGGGKRLHSRKKEKLKSAPPIPPKTGGLIIVGRVGNSSPIRGKWMLVLAGGFYERCPETTYGIFRTFKK